MCNCKGLEELKKAFGATKINVPTSPLDAVLYLLDPYIFPDITEWTNRVFIAWNKNTAFFSFR